MTMAAPKLRLGQLLIDQGLLTEQQLGDALVVQKSTGRMLGEVLVEKKYITPAILASTLAASAGIKVCQLRHGLIDPALLKLVGDEEAERLVAIPMFAVRDTLTVAMGYGPGALDPMFRNLNSSILISSGYTDAWANIIEKLGTHGSNYLPRLAQWFGNTAQSFSDWLDKMNNSGELQHWIDRGIEGLNDLGRVIKETGRIFYGLSKAAADAGHGRPKL